MPKNSKTFGASATGYPLIGPFDDFTLSHWSSDDISRANTEVCSMMLDNRTMYSVRDVDSIFLLPDQ